MASRGVSRRRGPSHVRVVAAVLVALAGWAASGPPAAVVAADVPGSPPRGRGAGPAAAISFSRQVAPLLVRSCGGCHVAGRRGGFQMASHAALMRSGMVRRGQGQASRLVEVILTGEMPRGGGTVSSADVATLIAWIDAGAACDAADPTVGLEVLARGAAAKAPARPPPVAAVSVGPGDVSFADAVAPVLQEQCLACHGGDETQNGLSMATLESLLRGGRSGPAVVAGRGVDSLLVRKLRGIGIEGQRMPLARPPLPESDVATIERWIDQGARLDILAGATPLEVVVAAGRARRLSDEALAESRRVAGERLWRRAIPDEEPGVQPREGVAVIGNLPPDRLAVLGDLAENVVRDVRREMGLRGPLLKGGIVLLAARQAIDYSALWQNVTGAERPPGVGGHAGVAADVVYAALLVPAEESDEDLRPRLADVLGAAAFAGRSAPGWFVQGAGRTIATRLAPRSAPVARWRREAAAAATVAGPADEFFAGHGDAAAAAAFVGGVASPRRLGQLAEALDEGVPFEEAFVRGFRTTPAAAFEAWSTRARRRERGAIR